MAAAASGRRQSGRLQPVSAQASSGRRRRQWCLLRSRSTRMEQPPQHLRAAPWASHAEGLPEAAAPARLLPLQAAWGKRRSRGVAGMRLARQTSAMHQAQAFWREGCCGEGGACGRVWGARRCSAAMRLVRTGTLDAAARACCDGVSWRRGGPYCPGRVRQRGGTRCTQAVQGCCVQPSSAVSACCG